MRPTEKATLYILGFMAIAGCVVVVLSFVGCGAREDAKYAAGFELCFQTATTCEEYLKCWQDNQRAAHRPVTGSCKGGSDAGINR